MHGKVPESCADIYHVPIRAKRLEPQIVAVEAGFFDDPDVHSSPNYEL
jgi:hypothetical protein